MMPGIAQAKPLSIGTNDFPCRPTLLISRSMMNAARAMYPVSSSSPRKKNRIRICGKKMTTPPTPAMMPSITRSRKSPSGNAAAAQPLTSSWADSIQPIGNSASRNIAKNISAITPRKNTQPHKRWVSTASMRSLVAALAPWRRCAAVASSCAHA